MSVPDHWARRARPLRVPRKGDPLWHEPTLFDPIEDTDDGDGDIGLVANNDEPSNPGEQP